MTPLEIEEFRRDTREFVAANPTTVVFTEYVRERSPSGGWREVGGDAREPQTVRLIPQGGTQVIADESGTQRRVDYTMIGDVDLVVARGDRFVHGAEWLQVIEFHRSNGYETRARVSSLVEPPPVVPEEPEEGP